MPRVNLPMYPLSGLFGIAKPSGPTSMSIINDVKTLLGTSKLFIDPDKLERSKKSFGKRGRRNANDLVKMGQGGTLDPLADGVLVVGIGKGTKKLTEFLDCVKEYRTTCLLGCETDTYDSEGARVRVAPWTHVTREHVEAALAKFRGEIQQTPPIFSALKMDGKPLYAYAREGIPLPRPIEKRQVTVHSLDLVEWQGSSHDFKWPEKALSDDAKKAMETALTGIEENPSLADAPETPTDVSPTAFVLTMKVSAGTYVRSIVHDLAHALGSAGHVVTLTRSRQGRFCLEPKEETDKGCVPWEVLSKATEDSGAVNEEGWTEWEQQVLDKLDIVENVLN